MQEKECNNQIDPEECIALWLSPIKWLFDDNRATVWQACRITISAVYILVTMAPFAVVFFIQAMIWMATNYQNKE